MEDQLLSRWFLVEGQPAIEVFAVGPENKYDLAFCNLAGRSMLLNGVPALVAADQWTHHGHHVLVKILKGAGSSKDNAINVTGSPVPAAAAPTAAAVAPPADLTALVVDGFSRVQQELQQLAIGQAAIATSITVSSASTNAANRFLGTIGIYTSRAAFPFPCCQVFSEAAPADAAAAAHIKGMVWEGDIEEDPKNMEAATDRISSWTGDAETYLVVDVHKKSMINIDRAHMQVKGGKFDLLVLDKAMVEQLLTPENLAALVNGQANEDILSRIVIAILLTFECKTTKAIKPGVLVKMPQCKIQFAAINLMLGIYSGHGWTCGEGAEATAWLGDCNLASTAAVHSVPVSGAAGRRELHVMHTTPRTPAGTVLATFRAALRKTMTARASLLTRSGLGLSFAPPPGAMDQQVLAPAPPAGLSPLSPAPPANAAALHGGGGGDGGGNTSMQCDAPVHICCASGLRATVDSACGEEAVESLHAGHCSSSSSSSNDSVRLSVQRSSGAATGSPAANCRRRNSIDVAGSGMQHGGSGSGGVQAADEDVPFNYHERTELNASVQGALLAALGEPAALEDLGMTRAELEQHVAGVDMWEWTSEAGRQVALALLKERSDRA